MPSGYGLTPAISGNSELVGIGFPSLETVPDFGDQTHRQLAPLRMIGRDFASLLEGYSIDLLQ
jgi:hypothetical protein